MRHALALTIVPGFVACDGMGHGDGMPIDMVRAAAE